jgi:hypothetical protein
MDLEDMMFEDDIALMGDSEELLESMLISSDTLYPDICVNTTTSGFAIVSRTHLTIGGIAGPSNVHWIEEDVVLEEFRTAIKKMFAAATYDGHLLVGRLHLLT